MGGRQQYCSLQANQRTTLIDGLFMKKQKLARDVTFNSMEAVTEIRCKKAILEVEAVTGY